MVLGGSGVINDHPYYIMGYRLYAKGDMILIFINVLIHQIGIPMLILIGFGIAFFQKRPTFQCVFLFPIFQIQLHIAQINIIIENQSVVYRFHLKLLTKGCVFVIR